MGIKLKTRNRKALKYGLIGAVSMLIICSSAGAFGYSVVKKNERETIRNYEKRMAELEKWSGQNAQGWALVRPIKAGEKVTKDMLKRVTLPKGAASEDTDVNPIEFINRYSKMALPKHTVLTRQLVFEERELTNDLRHVEYSFVQLPKQLKKDDYIDIRIQFPSGDDYIVLSHFKIEQLSATGTVFGKVDESQILTMGSAMVDAWLNDAKIYALTYVEKNVQQPAIVTYPVKRNVLELIRRNPNIVNVAALTLENSRSDLDGSLGQLTDEQKRKIIQARDEVKQSLQQEEQEQDAQMSQQSTLSQGGVSK